MSEILKKIKTKGYWEVILRPNEFIENRINNLKECKDIVRDMSVLFRGWDYPHYDHNNPPRNGLDFIEQETEYEFLIEYWRYYKSGQFIHYFSMMEDWQNDKRFPQPCMYILATLYTITEIYEFASRLTYKGYMGEACNIEVNLFKTKNRQLVMTDLRRHLFADYVCKIDEIPYKDIFTSDLLTTKTNELSLKHTIWLFEKFNWDLPPESVLKDEQEKLISRKL